MGYLATSSSWVRVKRQPLLGLRYHPVPYETLVSCESGAVPRLAMQCLTKKLVGSGSNCRTTFAREIIEASLKRC